MKRRSLKTIEESLLEQFNKFSRRGDQPGPEMAGGSYGSGSVTTSPSPNVWSRGGKPIERPPGSNPPAAEPAPPSSPKTDYLGRTPPTMEPTPAGKPSSKPSPADSNKETIQKFKSRSRAKAKDVDPEQAELNKELARSQIAANKAAELKAKKETPVLSKAQKALGGAALTGLGIAGGAYVWDQANQAQRAVADLMGSDEPTELEVTPVDPNAPPEPEQSMDPREIRNQARQDLWGDSNKPEETLNLKENAHPPGVILTPDWKRYQSNYKGSLVKDKSGRWMTSDGKHFINNPQLIADLEAMPAPESWADKLSNLLPGDNKPADAVKAKEPAKVSANPSEFAAAIVKELEAQGITDPYVKKAILAKVSQESSNKLGSVEVPYTNTSNARIRDKLPQFSRMTDDQLNTLKADPKAFFNKAYGGKLGNTDPDDGYNYRGRGLTGLTGKSNYAEVDKALGLNGKLVNNPDLLLDPDIDRRATAFYYKKAGADKAAFKNQEDANRWAIHKAGGQAYAPGTRLGNTALADLANRQNGNIPAASDASVASSSKPRPGSRADDLYKIQTQATADLFGPRSTIKVDDLTQDQKGLVDAEKQAAAKRSAEESQRKQEEKRAASEKLEQEILQKKADQEEQRKAQEIRQHYNIDSEKAVQKPSPDIADIDSMSPIPPKQPEPSTAKQLKGAWDKGIELVTGKKRIDPNDATIQLPEAINTNGDLIDLLRLAGRRKI